MKFVIISGGLGNQMFGYAFCLSIRKRGHKAVILITRNRFSKAYHHGYELDRIFQINKGIGFIPWISAQLLMIYIQFLRLLPQEYKKKLLNLVGIKIVATKENFIYYPEVFNFKSKHELFSGTWQSEMYFAGSQTEVRNSYIFNSNMLSYNSKQLYNQISKSNSVSIHIRRGDYLSNQYLKGFGGICTYEYYLEAIEYIKVRNENVTFYIFSDDNPWVHDNLIIEDSLIVDFNKDKDSWQDMFLMSMCKHNIIANSSFSWWAAWLNPNPDKVVIAPKRWWNDFEKDDVVPESWIRL